MVDVLPVELLQLIFDLLSAVDRKSASLVCHRWRQVLWSDRYVKRMTAVVTGRTLCSQWALQRMQRPFRKVNIEEDLDLEESERKRFLTRVRKLISSRVVRSSVQELRLVVSHPSLNGIFGQQVAVCFPKLKELSYTPGSRLLNHEDVPARINAHAPQLRVLKIDVFTDSAIELIRMASRQIHSLSMRFYDKRTFLRVLEIESFDSCREATFLTVLSGQEDYEMLHPNDFNATHRMNLAKLDKLEIRDAANMFSQVYDIIFRASVSLSQLHVFGTDISNSALASIHSMKKLKRLHLYLYGNNG